MITASDDGTVRVWRTRDWRTLGAPVGVPIVAAKFSPDGRTFVVSTADKDVLLWDVRTRREVARLHHPDSALGAVFMPDGRHVVTGGLEGSSGSSTCGRGPVATLRGHRGAITAVAASPTGGCWPDEPRRDRPGVGCRHRRAVAVMRGQPVAPRTSFSPKSTRIVTGASTGPPASGRRGAAISSAPWSRKRRPQQRGFTPDGKEIVTASDDASVHVAECEACAPAGRLLELAKQRVHRELTAEERRTYSKGGS